MPIIMATIANVVCIITFITIALLVYVSDKYPYPDFGKSLGLPDLSELKDVFQFNMKSITLERILDFLEEIGETELKEDINKVLREVQVGLCFIITHMLLYSCIIDHNLLCCFVIAHSLLCCFIIAHNLQCYFIIAHNLLCCFIIAHNLQCYFIIAHNLLCCFIIAHNLLCVLLTTCNVILLSLTACCVVL